MIYIQKQEDVKIYSVGVWNSVSILIEKQSSLLKFTPLEFETF